MRAVVPQAALDAALEEVRRNGTRLISVNPVRATLEDYFVERLADTAEVRP